ncbi:MAG TPA: hypothetical protein DIW54_08845, partial [Chitinophagaceae bacterium]|nr:hypothetical protein [Chitinophagaceae bacterium]
RPKVWKAIQAEVKPAGKVLTITTLIKWAAAACVVALAGVGIWSVTNHDKNSEQVAISTPKAIPPAVKSIVPDSIPVEQKINVANATAEPLYATTKKP